MVSTARNMALQSQILSLLQVISESLPAEKQQECLLPRQKPATFYITFPDRG